MSQLYVHRNQVKQSVKNIRMSCMLSIVKAKKSCKIWEWKD